MPGSGPRPRRACSGLRRASTQSPRRRRPSASRGAIRSSDRSPRPRARGSSFDVSCGHSVLNTPDNDFSALEGGAWSLGCAARPREREQPSFPPSLAASGSSVRFRQAGAPTTGHDGTSVARRGGASQRCPANVTTASQPAYVRDPRAPEPRASSRAGLSRWVGRRGSDSAGASSAVGKRDRRRCRSDGVSMSCPPRIPRRSQESPRVPRGSAPYRPFGVAAERRTWRCREPDSLAVRAAWPPPSGPGARPS